MEFKHVKIGVCLDLNKVKMVRHIRFHDSEEVYLFNPDGYDPEAHYKHLQERIKSFKCSKGKPAEIDWYLFPPYLSDYVNESNAFVFNGQPLSPEREQPIYSGKALSLFSWQCLEYMQKFELRYAKLSGADKFKVLQGEFAGDESIQALIFHHKSTGTWQSFVEIFGNHLKSSYFQNVWENENIKFNRQETMLQLASNYLDFYMLAYKGATMQDAIIRTCTKIKQEAGLKLILNSTFQKKEFLHDLDQLIKLNSKQQLNFSVSTKPNDSKFDASSNNLLDKSAANASASFNKSLASNFSDNTMRRLDQVIRNVASNGENLTKRQKPN